MTDEPVTDAPRTEPPEPTGTSAVHRIVVPPQVPMVALLGTRDEILRGIEPVSYTHLTLPTSDLV